MKIQDISDVLKILINSEKSDNVTLFGSFKLTLVSNKELLNSPFIFLGKDKWVEIYKQLSIKEIESIFSEKMENVLYLKDDKKRIFVKNENRWCQIDCLNLKSL